MALIGILGTGSLARLMVRGFAGAGIAGQELAGQGHQFLLSPRGAETAAALRAEYGYEVAASNQDVVDRADAIFVSLPVDVARGTLADLTFRPGQTVLSAVTGLGHDDLCRAVAPALGFISMMPGYANAFRLGPSLLYPDDPFWRETLSQVGPVHAVASEETFTIAACFGAFSGATMTFMAEVTDWFVAQGLDPDSARALVAETLRGNAEVLLQEGRPIEEIAKGVTTPGGITLMLLDLLKDRGALAAWGEGLDGVLKRIRGD
ncbi:MAG: pyrroline-5-carboxylate reductase dimerization domain-containing protein [Paracoccaceae bacterium]